MSARSTVVWLLTACATACGKLDRKELPTYGEVVVAIDTDAPVPQFVSRLRIDLFDDRGTWFASRDVGRPSRGDWPASFSLYTTDERSPRTVLVRARAYLEGRLRQYRGERHLDRRPYVEPHVPQSLDELCADLPTLALGPELTLRHGSKTLTSYIPDRRPPSAPADWKPTCGHDVVGGAVAARLVITAEDDYRVATTRYDPPSSRNFDTSLFIRTDCRDPSTQIACADDQDPDKAALYRSLTATSADFLASTVVHLEPGTYTVMAAGYYEEAAEITLRADHAASWGHLELPPPRDEPGGSLPRLVSDGKDITPTEEPEPLVTIDRLVRIEITPGQKHLASIVLRTSCAGWMARLSAAGSDEGPILAEAQTCIDTEGQMVPLRAEPLSTWTGAPPMTSVGELPFGESCPASTTSPGAVCIPAGMFVLGSPATADLTNTVPERFALVNRFWLDRTEVTVGRWRAALKAGFVSPDETAFANDDRLLEGVGQDALLHLQQGCTFSSAPNPMGQPREDFPVTCVTWRAARALCQFQGGDLPTEAQWEYAAAKAGRTFETSFPWGEQDQAPSCDQAVFGRVIDPIAPVGSQVCSKKGEPVGPAAVTDPAAMRDVTALGVEGLGGNVSEWVLDSHYDFDSPCWNGAKQVDPLCWDDDATAKAARGGSFTGSGPLLQATFRIDHDPFGLTSEPYKSYGFRDVGLRCAYREEPR